MDIEARIAEARRLYERRIGVDVSPEIKEQIEKDYLVFERVIKGIMEGQDLMRVAKSVGRCYETVYEWVNYGKYPKYLSCACRKDVDFRLLEKSDDFCYLLGAYQARAKKMDNLELVIKSKNLRYIEDISRRIKRLFGKVSFTVAGGIAKASYTSIDLMNYIRKITKENTIIPYVVVNPKKKERAYFRGFFDSRLEVLYCGRKIRGSIFKRRFPRLVIRKENKQLLSQVGEFLERQGIGFVQYNSSLMINRQGGISRFLGLNLVSKPKHEKLKQLYEDYSELMSIDFRGRVAAVRDKIDMENEMNREKSSLVNLADA